MFSTELLQNLPQKLSTILQLVALYLPEMVLALGMIVLLLLDVLLFKKKKLFIFYFLNLSSIIFLGLAFLCIQYAPETYFRTYQLNDPICVFAQKTILLVSILTLIMLPFSTLIITKNGFNTDFKGEFFSLFLALCLGLLGIVKNQNSLLNWYVFLEITSLSSYIISILHFDKKAAEGSLKYLLYGSVASGVMLYGMSFLYGITGSLDAQLIFSNPLPPLGNLGILLTMVGFLFKASTFPLHIWTPDVYEASPAPLVAYFSLAPKLAGLVVLSRISVHPIFTDNTQMIVLLSAMTMAIGNLAALWQQNIKRLLAYSTVAHAGLMVIMMTKGSFAPYLFNLQDNRFNTLTFAVLYYWLVYAIVQLAIFLWLEVWAIQFEKNQIDKYALTSYKSLGRKYPFWGVMAFVLMLGLTGLPPLVTFWGKLLIFSGIWQMYQAKQEIFWVAYLIFAVLNTVIGLFYYLKLPYYLFFKPMQETNTTKPFSFPIMAMILLTIACLILLYLFFYPENVRLFFII